MLCNPKCINRDEFLKIPAIESQDAYWLNSGGPAYVEEHLDKSVVAVSVEGALFCGIPLSIDRLGLHGIIWSHRVFGQMRAIRKYIFQIFQMFPAFNELVVVVPAERMGLRKFVHRLGFQYVGNFKNIYPDVVACQTGSQYSILRKNIGGHHG
jgi:hypothetical protein